MSVDFEYKGDILFVITYDDCCFIHWRESLIHTHDVYVIHYE